MRDENGREAQPLLQRAQVAAHGHPQLGVEIGQWFVEQQHLGLYRDSARQRHALLLAAGKLRRAAVGQFGEADQRQRFLHAPVDLCARQAALLQTEGNVAEHRHMRPQRVALEDQPDIALPGRQRGDVDAIELHLSRVCLGEAGDQAQQRRLAAARGAEEGEELARLYREVDALQHMRGTVGEVDPADVDGDCFGHGRFRYSSRPRDRCERSAASCESHMQMATMITAMTPKAAPAPRPAGVCIST